MQQSELNEMELESVAGGKPGKKSAAPASPAPASPAPASAPLSGSPVSAVAGCRSCGS
jgi:hypothetical protein